MVPVVGGLQSKSRKPSAGMLAADLRHGGQNLAQKRKPHGQVNKVRNVIFIQRKSINLNFGEHC